MNDQDVPGAVVAQLPELTTEQVLAWRAAMLPAGAQRDDAGSDLLIEGCSAGVATLSLIEALTLLASAVSARQAVATAEFAVDRGAELAARNQPTDRIGSAIGAQIALARHESPHRGSAWVKAAQDLTTTLPHTLAALFDGTINERRAVLVAQKASWLTDAHQRELDAQVASRLPGLSDQRAADTAAGIAYRLDPQGAMRRVRGAVTDRRVSIRPAPDTMVYLSAFLPVADGVAAYAALKTRADAGRLAGDPRSIGQLMADDLVATLTGRTTGVGAVATRPGGVPDCAAADSSRQDAACTFDAADDDSGIAAGSLGRTLDIMMIMTDRTLFDGDDEPAHLIGYGHLPAPLARNLATGTGYDTVRIRRLFTDPLGRLVAMETRSRTFTDGMKQFILARDQRCRTPWCNAPIAHADHTQTHAAGGPTAQSNGNGRCARCNYDKETNQQRETSTDHGHTIRITMPTGHDYTSTAPPPPRSTSWYHNPASTVEIDFMYRLHSLEYAAG